MGPNRGRYMKMSKTILISIILFFTIYLSGEYIYTDFDSLQIDGYVKTCRDYSLCELEFFKMMIFKDSMKFRVSSNDSDFTDMKSLTIKPHIICILNLFLKDLKVDTLKMKDETLFIIKDSTFSDTLHFKKNHEKPSNFHFTRENLPYIAYFTNFVKHKEKSEILK